MSKVKNTIKINLISEVMNDGSGDWGWVKQILNILKKNGFVQEQIRIIFINTYDYGSDIKNFILNILSEATNESNLICTEHKSNSVNIDDFEDSDNIRFIINKIEKETFKKRKNIFDNLNAKIYKHDVDLKKIDFENVKDIFSLLIKSSTGENVNKNDLICRTKEENFRNIIDKIKFKAGESNYPIYQISNILAGFEKTPIFYFGITDYISAYGAANPNLLKLTENCINLHFKTQDRIADDERIPNRIVIREGGHTKDGAINSGLSLENHGLLEIENPIGNLKQLDFYLKNINSSLERTTTHIAYISLGDSTHARRLNAFIKILGYTVGNNNHNILLMGNVYDKIFIDSSNNYKLDNDINVTKSGDYYTVTFNSITLNIFKAPYISMINNGFSFAYALKNTNDICMVSGDISYQEALSLRKKAIHVWLGNKDDMIKSTLKALVKKLGLQTIEKYQRLYSPGKYEEAFSKETNSNDFFKTLADLINNSDYTTKLNQLINEKGSFNDSLIKKIKEKVISLQKQCGESRNCSNEECNLITINSEKKICASKIFDKKKLIERFNVSEREHYNKYLKYKQKYLNLKKKLKIKN